MVRPGNPTLKPTLTVNGPFDIDEGSVATVTATAKPPVTRAWMQLFTEQDHKGRYVVVDYDDYVLDYYNYLAAFESPFSFYERDPLLAVVRAALLQRAGDRRRHLQHEHVPSCGRWLVSGPFTAIRT